MNYQEFRDLWHEALQAARLQIPYPIGPTERVNLRDMSRSYELVIYGGANPKCEPFHLTVTIEWNWDAVLSARFETTEEDMLMQIFGDFGTHDDDTVPPRLRMDVCLSAGVVYGTVYPMPALTPWQRWVRQTSDELQALLLTGYDEDGGVCAYSDPIQASVKLMDDGQLGLERVTFKAWQIYPEAVQKERYNIEKPWGKFPMKSVAIHTCTQIEAAEIQARLEAEGIPVALFKQSESFTNTVVGGLSTMEIHVRTEDETRAREVLGLRAASALIHQRQLPAQRRAPQPVADQPAIYLRRMLSGLAWFVGGITLTWLSMKSNALRVVFLGAILYGLYQFISGLVGWWRTRRRA